MKLYLTTRTCAKNGIQLRYRALKVKETFRDPLALGLQKDSEFRPLFDYYLEKMSESGLLDRMKTRWKAKALASRTRLVPQTTTSLGYDLLIGPFVLIAYSIATSILLLLLEKLIHYVNRHYKKKV